jgi:hypothetical protein
VQDPSEWPAQAVHDTVAAIARRPEYARALQDTLLGRFFEWVNAALHYLLELSRGSAPARAVMWTLVALLVALVVARIVASVRETERRRRGLPSVALASADPWGDARRLAGAGSYTEAAHALFAALLMACAARGELRPHPSKTTGDYARELRRRGAPSADGFARFRTRYDRIIFGDLTCDAAGYEELLAEARPLLDLVQRRAA